MGGVGASRASTYVNEHRPAQLFNQVLDLCGVEGGVLLSWCWYGVALLVLLKAADIFKAVVEVGHRLCTCGISFTAGEVNSSSSAGTNSQLGESRNQYAVWGDTHMTVSSSQW